MAEYSTIPNVNHTYYSYTQHTYYTCTQHPTHNIPTIPTHNMPTIHTHNQPHLSHIIHKLQSHLAHISHPTATFPTLCHRFYTHNDHTFASLISHQTTPQIYHHYSKYAPPKSHSSLCSDIAYEFKTFLTRTEKH